MNRERTDALVADVDPHVAVAVEGAERDVHLPIRVVRHRILIS
jgi:hypothetical protein